MKNIITLLEMIDSGKTLGEIFSANSYKQTRILLGAALCEAAVGTGTTISATVGSGGTIGPGGILLGLVMSNAASDTF